MLTIRKLTLDDLKTLEIAEGFARWISSSGEKGKSELRQLLQQRLTDGEEILVAIEWNLIIGFAVIANWATMPGGKALESMEVAKEYRGKGIGSELVKRILEEREAIVALTPYPEAGYEKALEEFYGKFGFKHITEDIMIQIPASPDKVKRWIEIVERLMEVYNALLKEMKARLTMAKPT